MYPHQLPQVTPPFVTRPISADEIIDIVYSKPVAGLNETDPVVQRLYRCHISNISRTAFTEARQKGYLWAVDGGHGLDAGKDLQHLVDVWCYWCAAAKHPEIVLRKQHETGALQLRCDLSTTFTTWPLSVFRPIAQLLGDVHLDSMCEESWIFTNETLEIDGLNASDALTVARGLVTLITRTTRLLIPRK